jgi:hypothetical protein
LALGRGMGTSILNATAFASAPILVNLTTTRVIRPWLRRYRAM